MCLVIYSFGVAGELKETVQGPREQEQMDGAVVLLEPYSSGFLCHLCHLLGMLASFIDSLKKLNYSLSFRENTTHATIT